MQHTTMTPRKDRGRFEGSRILIACLNFLDLLTAPSSKARWVSNED